MKSYVVLDQSGSMYRSWNHAKMMAQALFANASPASGSKPANEIGFITFHDQVHLQNYFETSPTPLNSKLASLSTPSGVTELVDALVTALVVDSKRPDMVYIISDLGENASEWSKNFTEVLNGHGVSWMHLVPPSDTTLLVPHWVMKEPPARIKVIDKLDNAKRLDLRTFTEPRKLIDAMNDIRLGKIDAYLVR